jgi:hypothetical protein
MESDNESNDGFMSAWYKLADGTEPMTPELINAGFECYCDPRGWSGKDLLSAIWDGMRQKLELQEFVDYDTAFRTWCAFFYNLAKYTSDCKRR